MKRLIGFITFIVILISGISVAFAESQFVQAEKVDYKIVIDDNQVNVKNPIISINDRTYLPLRELAEILDLYVTWDGENNLIKISDIGIIYDEENSVIKLNDENNITAEVTDFKVKVNGYIKELSNPVLTVNDRSYLPLREISELLGLEVNWEEKTQTIAINSNDEDLQDDSDDVQLLPFEHNGLWGYMDYDGNVKIEPQFKVACDFSDGLAAVSHNEYDRGHGFSAWTFIDENGNIVIEGNKFSSSQFSEGLVRYDMVYEDINPEYKSSITISVAENFMDKNGNDAFDGFYEDCGDFHDGYAAVVKYDSIEELDKEVWERNYRYGYIDKTGNLVKEYSTTDYPEIDDLGDFHDGYAIIEYERGITQIINTDFEVLADISEYKWTRNGFGNGFLVVKKDDKYGVIDMNGNVIIDCKYDSLGAYNEGLFCFRSGENKGYIDINDNVVIDGSLYEDIGAFFGGIAVVEYKNNPGVNALIDKNGDCIIRELPLELGYWGNYNYLNGIIRVWNDDNTPQYINSKGELIVPKITMQEEESVITDTE